MSDLLELVVRKVQENLPRHDGRVDGAILTIYVIGALACLSMLAGLLILVVSVFVAAPLTSTAVLAVLVWLALKVAAAIGKAKSHGG